MLPINHIHTTLPPERSSEEPNLNTFSENIRSVTNRNFGKTEQTYSTATDKEMSMPSTSFSSLQPLLNPTEIALPQKDTYGEMKMHTHECNSVPGRIKKNALSIFNSKYNQLLIEEWEKWAQKVQSGGQEQRNIALNRLKYCVENRTGVLDLIGLSLTELPENFPICLNILNVSHNQLPNLPENLPFTLKKLYASDNRLIYLTNNLPSTLEILIVSNNQLTRLPENLNTILVVDATNNPLITDKLLIEQWEKWAQKAPPEEREGRDIALNRLKYCFKNRTDILDLTGLRLTELPNNLPDNVRFLKLNNNKLTHLPLYLSSMLEEMEVINNQLTALPEFLPFTLNKLNVGSNWLPFLPDNLPSQLNTLLADRNYLVSLTKKLPDMLEVLDVSNNRLKHLHENLPPGLKALIN